MSSTSTPNAATIIPEPSKLHIVIDPALNRKSVMRTSTMVNRLPTDVRTGPHRPRSICVIVNVLATVGKAGIDADHETRIIHDACACDTHHTPESDAIGGDDKALDGQPVQYWKADRKGNGGTKTHQ